MNILVTGASGFIGSHLIKKLEGTKVNTFALKRINNKLTNKKNISWINKGLEDLILKDFININAVIHLACVGVSPKNASKTKLEEINVKQSLRLIDLACKAGVKRFVAAGTCLEYGKEANNWEKIPANANLKPLCPYSKSKAKSFKLIYDFACKNKIELFYGRIFSAYGKDSILEIFGHRLNQPLLVGKL